MTLADLFRSAQRHLLGQRRRSEDERGLPRYHGPGGLRCPVGVLIAEEHHREAIEGLPATDPGVLEALARSLGREAITRQEAALLRDLQVIHDEARPRQWRRRLAALAAEYRIEWEE